MLKELFISNNIGDAFDLELKKFFVSIELCFLMLFVIVLLDIHQKRNISLAINTLSVLIIIMIIKVFMWLWALMNNLNMCQFSKKLYCN